MIDHAKRISDILKDFGSIYVGARLSDDYRVIDEQEVNSSRWSRYDMMVIEGPYGSLWGVEQESGLTEYQEVDEPFGYDDPIPVYPLKTVPTFRYEKNTNE